MPLFRVGKPKLGLSFSTNTVVPSSLGDTPIPFHVVDFAEGELSYESTTQVVTIELEGLYLVTLVVSRAAPPASDATFVLVRRSSIDYVAARAVSSTQQALINVAMPMQLLVGETLQPIIRSNNQTFTIRAYPNTGTFFSVVRIGPKRWT